MSDKIHTLNIDETNYPIYGKGVILADDSYLNSNLDNGFDYLVGVDSVEPGNLYKQYYTTLKRSDLIYGKTNGDSRCINVGRGPDEAAKQPILYGEYSDSDHTTNIVNVGQNANTINIGYTSNYCNLGRGAEHVSIGEDAQYIAIGEANEYLGLYINTYYQNVTLQTIKDRDAATVSHVLFDSPYKADHIYNRAYFINNLCCPHTEDYEGAVNYIQLFDSQYAINIGKFNTTLKYPHHYCLVPKDDTKLSELTDSGWNTDVIKKLWDYDGYNQFILMHNGEIGIAGEYKLNYHNGYWYKIDVNDARASDVQVDTQYYNTHKCASALSINPDTFKLNDDADDVLPTYNVDLGYCANNVSIGAPSSCVTIGNCISMTDDRFWPMHVSEMDAYNLTDDYNSHGDTLKASAPKVYGEVHVGDYVEKITIGNALGGIDMQRIKRYNDPRYYHNVINIGYINDDALNSGIAGFYDPHPYIGIGTHLGYAQVPGIDAGLYMTSAVPGKKVKIVGSELSDLKDGLNNEKYRCKLQISNNRCEIISGDKNVFNSIHYKKYSDDKSSITSQRHALFIGNGVSANAEGISFNELDYSTYISGIDNNDDEGCRTGVHIMAKPMLINNTFTGKKLIDDVDQYTMTIAPDTASIDYVYEYKDEAGDTGISSESVITITRKSTESGDGQTNQTNVIVVGGSIMPSAGSNESIDDTVSLGSLVEDRPFGYVYANYLYGTPADTSDERLKNFGDNITVDFDKLAQLRKAYFTWKDEKKPGTNIGMSAQEIRDIYPEIVHELDNGTLTVEYPKLAVIALAAVDELHKKNVELESRLSKIESMLEKLT
jgi:hypothetical protein